MSKLYFYYAAMNAGKTTTLLQSSYNYNERGMDTLLYIPAFDDRGGVCTLKSRVGLTSKAIPFNENFDFFNDIQNRKKQNLKCILIDEAQFLSKSQVENLCKVVDELRYPVLTYGLRTDFLGETFEGSKYLLAWAEELIEIKTICHCGSKAIMNARIDENGRPVHHGNQIEIGGNDRYISLCRKHYKEGNTGYNKTGLKAANS
ncbi:MAG TPA: thymidine kinase [Holosporales bacterium]|nr:thymidine kinase [Holosporales bacterium]